MFAVIGVELIGLPLSILFERWKGDRKKMRAKTAKEENEKKPEKREGGEA